MAKRDRAVSATAAKKRLFRKTKADDSETGPESITTAIHVPMATWSLLRAVAFHRAQANGGRASVSKLITDLVESHRSELERETRK